MTLSLSKEQVPNLELESGNYGHEKGLETLPTNPRKWSKSQMPAWSHERRITLTGKVKTTSCVQTWGCKFTVPTQGESYPQQ